MKVLPDQTNIIKAKSQQSKQSLLSFVPLYRQCVDRAKDCPSLCQRSYDTPTKDSKSKFKKRQASMVMFVDMSKEEALSPFKSSLRHSASKIPLLLARSSNRKSLKASQVKLSGHYETYDKENSSSIKKKDRRSTSQLLSVQSRVSLPDLSNFPSEQKRFDNLKQKYRGRS